MYGPLHILCLAVAAVIDTVLLLAVLERRNRRYVMAPVLVLVLGGWLWHAGVFAFAWFAESHRDWTVAPSWAAMVVMSAGLLLMPSAMLHGVWRIHRTGLDVLTRPHGRYLLAYLPMLAVAPIAWHLARQPATEPFVDRVWPLVPVYGAWLTLANVATAVGFLRLRRLTDRPSARRFFAWMAATLVALVVLHAFTFVVAIPTWPAQRSGWMLATMLSPVAPALVFAYYVVRHNFMQVVIERTVVYGAIVAGGLLFHELAIRPMTGHLSGRFGLNFVIVEMLLVLGLIVAYQPLRQRAAESLRYLMGERVRPMRDQTRRLAVWMSEHAADPPEELLRWFAPALRDALGVSAVRVCVFENDGLVVLWASAMQAGRSGEPSRTSDESAVRLAAPTDSAGEGTGSTVAHHSDAESPFSADSRHRNDELRVLRNDLLAAGMIACAPRDAPTDDVLDHLRDAESSLAVLLRHQQVDGLLLVGKRPRNRDLSEEETNAAILLAEQLAVTLNVGLLQVERLAAERRALQGEKLAMLGLVASSIAHEVKNPLSSIKTIATVLAEDLGPDDPRTRDVRLIAEQIDRLSATTSRLLRFARPAAETPGRRASVDEVLAGTLHVMGHLARQQGVEIHYRPSDDLPAVTADEDSLREVFTNLIANSIEAAATRTEGTRNGNGAGGVLRIEAACRDDQIIVSVEDNGPGLPDVVRRRLFEPFVTTRETGTGLGLYIVGRRVRELGGTIRCESPIAAGGGTRFTVTI